MRRPKQDLSVGPLHVRCMRRTLSRRRIVAASHHSPTTLLVPSPCLAHARTELCRAGDDGRRSNAITITARFALRAKVELMLMRFG